MRGPWGAIALVGLILVSCGGSDKAKNFSGGQPQSSVVTEQLTVPTMATTTTGAALDLQIVNKGFTQLPPNSIGATYLTYAVLLRNPNAAKAANRVDVNMTFSDTAGTVVASKSDTIAVVLPNQTIAVSGLPSDSKGAAKMDVQARVASWEDAAGTGSFSTEGVSVAQGLYGSGPTVHGTVVSTFAKDVKKPKAVAVFYGRTGAIVGGSETFVDFVPAGGRVGFEIPSFTGQAPTSRAEVYMQLTSLSLTP
jgi:hypothetical protein